ncbi:MAG: ABC transporter substrate-binding protein [Prevotella sp.]|nr:ABC transporter substrate-binding protein [Prevotella sp.]
MKRVNAFLVLTAVLLSSCGGQTARRQEDGDTLKLRYATLLAIVRHDGYTEAAIRNPWKEGMLLHTYLLVPRGQELPEGMPHGTLIRTPVRRAAVFTTVHCALLNTLGHGDDIVGVADLKYIKVPYIHERVRAGKVADCGGGLNPVVEKIMDVKPDVIMLSPFENSGGYGKLEDLDIPLVECAEYMENSPLARAEWMKFYGLLYGEEEQTAKLFAAVDSSYNALCRRAREAGRGRSLLIDRMVGSVWYVPGGKSTIGQMAQDAGARYPWAADDHSGSLALPFETVLERAGETEVWMYRYSSDHDQDYAELLSEHRGYDQLRPFRQRQVYGCNVEQTLFYEETPFRPDFLLADFIQIVHPGITNLPPLRYYKKLDE